MIVSFFSNRLNHHQAPVADALYKQLEDSFKFVELCPPNIQSTKGSNEDFSTRPYLVQAWKNEENHLKARKLAVESDVAVFGAESLSYEILRMKTSAKLAFEMSERWLKRGLLNLLSPRLLKYQWYYHTCFYNKPLYKLCAGAYSANDQYLMHSFKNRCYKWGYFTKVDRSFSPNNNNHTEDAVRMMWCARFLKLKHPEIVVFLARRLKKRGVHFIVDMYGDGPVLEQMKALAKKVDVSDVVAFHGAIPNDQVLQAMREHDIFLFTSDRNEGWGAVANEAMSNGCVLVASDAIGSTPYLIDHRVTGCVFQSENIDSLESEMLWLIENREEMTRIRQKSYEVFCKLWTPEHAALSLLQLIDCLMNGKDTNIEFGPCSKAIPC